MLWTALGLVAAGLALWAVSGVLLALLFVGVFTFLSAPVVAWLETRRIPRSVGAALVIMVSALAITGLAALVLPALIGDLVELARATPELLSVLAGRIETMAGITIPTTIKELSGLASTEVVEQLSPFAKSGGALMGQGAMGIARGAASAAGAVLQVLLVPVITFFVLSELPEVTKVIWALWPERARPAAKRYGPLVQMALGGLVRGQLIVAAMMAGVYAVCLSIAGVPLALAISVLAGAAYLIPFASGTVCIVLAIAFSVLELGSDALRPIVGAVITAGIVQLVEGYILTPRIVGGKAGLSPLATLLAVLLGGSAAGFLGVLFALPAGAVIAIVVRDVARGRMSSSAEALGSAPGEVST
jgi:predicted PurR-regulated permease PerM